MEERYRHYTIHRIESRSKRMPNGCLEFQGGTNDEGYGLVSFTPEQGKRITTTAHRALYMAKFNMILPSHIQVLHLCDNPLCVDYTHLIDGTAKHNMQDAIRKKRHPGKLPQEAVTKTRQRDLSDDTVRAVRAATGKLSHIAEQFGITSGYASKLRRGKAKASVV